MSHYPAILIVDSSDHRRAGTWFAECLAGLGPAEIVYREDLEAERTAWRAVVLSGSERCIFENAPWIETQLAFVRNVVGAGVPLLGVCFGHQLIFRALYGKEVLARRRRPEVGWPAVTTASDPLFAGAGPTLYPYNFHFDEVAAAPAEWEVIASSEECRLHGVKRRDRPVVGLQFHPEVTAEEAVAGFRRERDLLAACGYDADEIIGTGEPRAGYYPEILRNFVKVYAS
ncbi:MAG: type 1 glutamine amidotransferase [Candidatus Coatesbacteria bacterium]|nr:MAG: type 1 glutamine amidotransferase [Candidatus Coatesbacteria bacterium]